MPRHLAALAVLALPACTTPQQAATDAPAAHGSCNADAAQGFVGKQATAEAGEQLLELTGARMLRWGPPRTAMTMDYRFDRLTVAYDDDMAITRVSCG
jgi:hypothetical protein